MYVCMPCFAGSWPARVAMVAFAAVAICCCTLPARAGIAARDHAVSPDNSSNTSTVTLPAPLTSTTVNSDHQFDSSGHLIANAITDSSNDGANSWLVFWQGAPSQPAVERNIDTPTTVNSDPAAKPATSTPLPIPVPNAFNAGTVGLLMLGCIMVLRRSRRWLA
jgi:hypothetical protein